MARSNEKRRRSVRDISEDEIIDALEDILSSADKTTVNFVSKGLADHFGVQRDEIKERFRDVILQRLGSPAALSSATDHRARSTCSASDARSKSRGASSKSIVSALLVQEPSHSAVDGRSTTSETQRTSPRGSSTSAPSIDDVTGTVPVQSKLPRSAGPRVAKSRLPSAPTPRGLTKLKDLAKSAGLLSPRSELRRSLKAAKSSKHEESLLRATLDNAHVMFSGRCCQHYASHQETLRQLSDLELLGSRSREEIRSLVVMASLTRDDLVRALEALLPPLDPTAVKFSTIMEDLAEHFGVTKSDLKAHHKEDLKQIIPDMIHLCKGGVDKENAPHNDEEDEDEDDEVVAKKPVKRVRGRRIQESEDEEDDEENEEDGSGDSDDEEDERPAKRTKKTSPATKKERAPAKRKTPAPRKPADKPNESEGMAALKELARVAGLLSPAVYALLKKAGSEEEQEAVLRERLEDAGVRFTSPYPKKSDIAAAKRKREKEKELDGIDTSLIITGGRSRRASAQQTSYVTKYDDDDEDEGDGGEQGSAEEEEIHDRNEEESEAHEESEASDDSEAEF